MKQKYQYFGHSIEPILPFLKGSMFKSVDILFLYMKDREANVNSILQAHLN